MFFGRNYHKTLYRDMLNKENKSPICKNPELLNAQSPLFPTTMMRS